MIDTATMTTVRAIQLGRSNPEVIAVSADGGRAVVLLDAKRVGVLALHHGPARAPRHPRGRGGRHLRALGPARSRRDGRRPDAGQAQEGKTAPRDTGARLVALDAQTARAGVESSSGPASAAARRSPAAGATRSSARGAAARSRASWPLPRPPLKRSSPSRPTRRSSSRVPVMTSGPSVPMRTARPDQRERPRALAEREALEALEGDLREDAERAVATIGDVDAQPVRRRSRESPDRRPS